MSSNAAAYLETTLGITKLTTNNLDKLACLPTPSLACLSASLLGTIFIYASSVDTALCTAKEWKEKLQQLKVSS